MHLTKTLAAAVLALLLGMTPAAAGTDHAAHQNGAAQEAVVDGIKVVLGVTDIATELQGKGLAVPKGLKETHHLSVVFREAGSGRTLAEGVVEVRVQGPGKQVETKRLIAMDGHFGGDFDLSQPGRYGIMCRFTMADGKNRQTMFWYKTR